MIKKTLAVAFAVSVVVIACSTEGPTTPPQTETLVRAPEPVVSATPIPAPRAVDPTPEPGSAFVLKFYDNAGFELFYNGGASYAGVTASITNFDDQDTPLPVPGYSDGIVPYTVASGSSWNYSFNRQCVQLDVDQPGVKLIGAAYFDQNGKRVSQINDEIRKACGATPCVEEWLEIESEPEITYGDYGLCALPQVEDDSLTEATTPQCSKKRTVTITYTEQNTCTKATRKGRTVKREESAPCDCPVTCNPEWKKFEDYSEEYPRYTSWSECNKDERTRYRIYYEQNTCTQAIREKERKLEKEECDLGIGYCHVSNKGSDKDINLVVEFKKNGEGHLKHTNDPKFCPKDTVVYGLLSSEFWSEGGSNPPPPPACKLEGKDTDLYCSCAPFLEAVKACPTK